MFLEADLGREGVRALLTKELAGVFDDDLWRELAGDLFNGATGVFAKVSSKNFLRASRLSAGQFAITPSMLSASGATCVVESNAASSASASSN